VSVAFEIEVTRSRRVSRLDALIWAIPAAGLALAAAQTVSGPTLLFQGAGPGRIAFAGIVLIGALTFARLAWRARRADIVQCRGVVLRVDDAGEPCLFPEDGRPVVPLQLRTSCRLPGLILLVLSPSGLGSGFRSRGSAVTLLSGRDGLADDDWRRLNAWLCWMERGRHTLPSS
jgi:hypothetical protein